MNERTVRELKELHAELVSTRFLSEDDRKLVKQLQDDIQELLARSENVSGQGYRSLLERLQDATDRFEVSHPQLTAVIGRVADSLSNMGI
jgi:hypothetical protein